MPEGDTIHRAAATLERAIGGKRVEAFRSSLPALADARLVGLRVARVEARGKNLLIHFEDGRVLHSHMRMTGSWHIYRPGERWWKPERQARAALETSDFVAVCFNAPVLELLSSRGAARNWTPSRLGPDVLDERFDAGEALARLRERPGQPLGEALLVQNSLAGIGNIYKSETLFAAGLSPWRTVGSVADEDLGRVIATARDLMSRNLSGSPRRTGRAPQGERYAVYRRRGRPCRDCGTPIAMRRQGAAGRSTYWCPTCQA